MSLIRNNLKFAVLSSTGIAMQHGDGGWQNLFAEGWQNAPAVATNNRAVYLMDPVRLRITNLSQMQEAYPVILCFLNKSQFDNNPTEHDGNTDVAKNDMRAFVKWCRDNDDYFSEIAVTEAVEVWNLFDACVDGWMLYCTVKIANAGSPC